MMFHENCLLADNSHEISNLQYFFENQERCRKLFWSAAVEIGALRTLVCGV